MTFALVSMGTPTSSKAASMRPMRSAQPAWRIRPWPMYKASARARVSPLRRAIPSPPRVEQRARRGHLTALRTEACGGRWRLHARFATSEADHARSRADDVERAPWRDVYARGGGPTMHRAPAQQHVRPVTEVGIAPWCRGGPSSKAITRLQDHHLVTRGRCLEGRGQPGEAAAHHDHPLHAPPARWNGMGLAEGQGAC